MPPSTVGPDIPPFRVEMSQADLDDLRERLTRTRWAEVIGKDSWTYGVEKSWLVDMVEYWIGTYDWRRHESAMNAWDHYRVEIRGMPIHFIHVPGKGQKPMPLVLTHGWPWTFWDMRDLIGPLSDPAAHGGDAADAFDVVVPSLPGYGFSAPLHQTGVDVSVVARTWAELMSLLGYDRFGAYGGDWGAMVSGHLGHAYPDRVVGVELSLPVIPGVGRRELAPADWSDDERWMLDRMAETERVIRSHVAVHSCDPQTLAYALADSPVGTAAWLWERRRAWSDCGGDIEAVFHRDDLITGAAIYWLTGTITSSLRLYFEHFNKPWPLAPGRRPGISVPTGFAVFPRDLVFLPRAAAERHCDLRRWTIMPRGGHFAPAEQPDLLVQEIRSFFRELR